MDRAPKKLNIWTVVLIVVVLVFITISTVRRINSQPKPVYVDGIRTEVYGGTPEENERVRASLVDLKKNGTNGLSPDQVRMIEQSGAPQSY